MTRRILCYGDSNTWGKDPETGLRYPKHIRWTGVLAEHLGKEYEIIEEGLISRTTVIDDPIEGAHKNGHHYLLPCLESHAPLDLVLLMLGTSDLKKRFSLSAADIAKGIEILIDTIQKTSTNPLGMAPEVLLLSPPPFGEGIEEVERYQGAKKQEELLAPLYKQVAEKKSCFFLETKKYIAVTSKDHLHLDAANHKKLAIATAAMISKIFE
jgi:lysophospholipase L1-like esterase